MRDIANKSALTDTVTKPVYLVQLDFSPPVYLSTAQEVSWGGYTWEPFAVSVGRVAFNTLGSANVNISVNNLDRSFGVLVLNQGARDRGAKVYVYYPEGPIDPFMLSEGVMDGCSIDEQVQINIVSRSSYYGRTPRILCAPPVFNHLPPTGTVIRWSNTSITLERR